MESAPLELPADHLPWEDAPDPRKSRTAMLYAVPVKNAIPNLLRDLIRDGYITGDEGNAILRTMAATLDRLTSGPDLSGMPRCRRCGNPCRSLIAKWCSGACRQAAYKDRVKASRQEQALSHTGHSAA
jgi:hypothetical protein